MDLLDAKKEGRVTITPASSEAKPALPALYVVKNQPVKMVDFDTFHVQLIQTDALWAKLMKACESSPGKPDDLSTIQGADIFAIYSFNHPTRLAAVVSVKNLLLSRAVNVNIPLTNEERASLDDALDAFASDRHGKSSFAEFLISKAF